MRAVQKPEARSQQPEELREIPPECLENGALREGIAERLERLQQAAHPQLANLLGVRKFAGRLFLAWQKVDGATLADAGDELSEHELYRLLRELIQAVEALHLLGLVHGNLRAENVIVTGEGICLTDASPFLWTDQEMDLSAVVSIVENVLRRRDLPTPVWDESMTLRRLASFLDGAYVPSRRAGRVSAVRLKRNNLVWAIVLLLLGLAVAVVIVWHFERPAAGLLQSSNFDAGRVTIRLLNGAVA